jgi:IMP dehydrogenase/GMP reductase
MEGSLRARNHRRYAQLPELFFEEGVVGYVPHAGSIYDKLPVIMQMVRAAFATTGCRTMDALHTHAVLERQSPVALQDSQIHDMVPVHGVS